MNTFELTDKYIMNTYKRLPISFERGEGIYLYDENGKKYLDFAAGIAVNCLGYGNEKFIDEMTKQLNKVSHVSNMYHIRPQAEAAKILCEASGLDKVFFCNSGAEANEAAIKLARKYGLVNKKGSKIIAMKNSFHGRTLGALTLTGQDKYQKSFVPLIGDVEYAEFNNIRSVEDLMNNDVCAVIIECIQGEGGIIPATNDFYVGLWKLCDKFGALMIVDEVQTGIGRCGKFFAFQNYATSKDDAPDIISVAKGLGNGIPIGAIVAKDDVACCFEPADHASTFGGNHIAATAAICVLSEIKSNGLIEKAQKSGEYLREKLLKLPHVKEVRGQGLMLGAEIDLDPRSVMEKCMKNGLLVVCAGADTIRFVPPLIIEDNDIDLAVEIFATSLSETQLCQQNFGGHII